MGVIKKLKREQGILSIIPLENGLKIERDSLVNGLWGRMKRCPSCKEYKERWDFYVCKDRYDGLSSYCKSCYKIKRKI